MRDDCFGTRRLASEQLSQRCFRYPAPFRETYMSRHQCVHCDRIRELIHAVSARPSLQGEVRTRFCSVFCNSDKVSMSASQLIDENGLSLLWAHRLISSPLKQQWPRPSPPCSGSRALRAAFVWEQHGAFVQGSKYHLHERRIAPTGAEKRHRRNSNTWRPTPSFGLFMGRTHRGGWILTWTS
jgi:hypothetical protein